MPGRNNARTGVDLSTPSVARMYDYALGGKDNFQVDRDALVRVAETVPDLREVAQENRAFLRRAVRFLARQGIQQFIDIGSGLPTAGNTHEVAKQSTPDARVVYIDNDPIVLAHGRALLATDGNTAVAAADMRQPAEVLEHPETARLIDFGAPVGVLLIAMLHYVDDEDLFRIVGSLHAALPAGSYLAATHTTGDRHPAETVAQVEAVYASMPTPPRFRTHAEVARVFAGFELIEPGLVTLDAWRPDPADPAPATTNWLYGGIGRKG